MIRGRDVMDGRTDFPRFAKQDASNPSRASRVLCAPGAVIGWRNMERHLEHAGKIKRVVVPDGGGDGLDLDGGVSEQPRAFPHAQAEDVLQRRHAGSLLEEDEEVGARDMRDGSQIARPKVFGEVMLDVGDGAVNFLVVGWRRPKIGGSDGWRSGRAT